MKGVIISALAKAIVNKLTGGEVAAVLENSKLLGRLKQRARRLLGKPAPAAESKHAAADKMKEGIQTDFPNAVLQRFGCYFFILMKWLEVQDGKSFTNADLISIFEKAVAAGMMQGDNAFIIRPVDLMNMALGRNVYCDITRDLPEPPANGTAIRRLVRGTAGETHFTLQIAGVEWDTLDPQRAAAASWRFDSFRVPV